MHAPFEATTALIPALHQPALLRAHVQAQEVDESGLLRGTGLAAHALEAHATLLSPAQYLRLLGNAAALLESAETSFVLGRQMLPGHFGAASHALLHAAHLRQALEGVVRHSARLSPLLVPHLVVEQETAVLYWTDGIGLSWQRPFVVEMQMAAVAAMCHWLGGERLPWVICFNRARPRHAEQHEVHLGTALRFDCHLDAMLIDTRHLDRPWPGAQAAGAALARQALALQADREAPGASLLGALYDHLLANVRLAPTLEAAARAFGFSPATLKRRLAAHGTHFQAELDLVRSHVALHLFRFRGCDNEAVARHLGFHDATNFRRSFKRWTGLTPSDLRFALGGAGA